LLNNDRLKTLRWQTIDVTAVTIKQATRDEFLDVVLSVVSALKLYKESQFKMPAVPLWRRVRIL
jgi:hypothetical protein